MKTSPTLRFLVFSFLILLSGCEQDTLTDQIEEQETRQKVENLSFIQELELDFSLKGFDDPAGQIRDNIEIDWNSHQSRIIDDLEWYEFKVNEKRPIAYENGRIKGKTYTLLATRDKKSVRFYLNKMLSFSDDNGNTYFDIEKDNYHGMVYLYNMKGVAEYIMHYQKGNKISGIENLEVGDALGKFVGLTAKEGCQLKASTAKPCESGAYECAMGLNTGPSCNGTTVGGGFLPRFTDHYTYWYNVRGDGSRDLNHIQYHGRTKEYVWVSNSGYSGAYIATNHAVRDGSGGVSYFRTAPRVKSPAKVIMDTSMKGTKALCVYEKLQSINGGLFKRTIGTFIDDPQYDLIFKVGNCTTTDEACTDGSKVSSNGQVTITIENFNQNAIGIAALLLHEGIHAELWRYVDQYKKGINPNDKAEVFRYYKHFAELYGDVFSGNTGNPKNKIDHVYMTQYYIDPIANALRELDNSRYPLDYYKDFAWVGLKAWEHADSANHYESRFKDYRKIVENNSNVCND